MKPFTYVNDVYPITTKTYQDGAVSMKFITDADLKNFTDPKRLKDLNDFLMGQTRAIEGVYAGDVERWLNSLPNND